MLEFVSIPKGSFHLGSTKEQLNILYKRFPKVETELLERELPQHEMFLDTYEISKYPITNSQFAVFIEETNYITTAESKKSGYIFTPNFQEVQNAWWQSPYGTDSTIKHKDNHPVVQVSWFDVVEFCKWLSEKEGQEYRLPTEAEWEKAARGTDKRIYPWGNTWDSSKCNAEYTIKDTTPVNAYEGSGDSPYGVSDMCGNVFEWTSTTIGSTKPWPSKYKYPYKTDDGRENMSLLTRRVGRGGSYSRSELYCRTSFRFADMPEDRYSAQGFRVVRKKLQT